MKQDTQGIYPIKAEYVITHGFAPITDGKIFEGIVNQAIKALPVTIQKETIIRLLEKVISDQ